MFYQDRYFVRLSASGDPEENGPALMACAQAIAEALPGDGGTPAELDLMQFDGVVPRSQKYIGESLLGYAFFPKGLIGEVNLDDRPVRAFVVFETSSDAAAEALERYVAYLEEEGGNPSATLTAAGEAIVANDPMYKGVIALQAGKHLIGVIGLADPARGAPILERLAARVQARSQRPLR